MKLLYIIIPIIFCLFLGVGFSKINSIEVANSSPEIIKYEITQPFKIKERWVCIPKNNYIITIKVFATNTKKMLFYLTPTGTQTYSKRKLIGKSSDKDGVFEITHKFSRNESILYHFSIEAINNKGERIKDILFNIQRCD